MTSSGQVTMPEVKPPIAPARALNWESEAWAAQCSKVVIGRVVMAVQEEPAVEEGGGMMATEVRGGCPYSAGEVAVDLWSSDIPLPRRGEGQSVDEGGGCWTIDDDDGDDGRKGVRCRRPENGT